MPIAPNELSSIVARMRQQQNDDGHVEAKSCKDQLSSDIWESVSAFANTGKGLLILGLNQSANFSPVKNFQLETVLSQFVTGMGDGGQPALLAHAPRYEIERVEFEGAIILVVEIHELDPSLKPCYIERRGVLGGSYKRVDDRDIMLSAAEVYELQHALVPSEADREVVKDANASDLNPSICDQIVAMASSVSPRAVMPTDSREVHFANLNLTNGEGRIMKAGLLCAGRYPQRFFPKLCIDVAVHPGTEKSQPGSPRFLDRVICEGTLGEMLEDALSAISKNLRRVSIVHGTSRTDELEIPEEVLREALANALVHREYSAQFEGQSVSVDIYPDRIEVINPGGMWGGKTIENLGDGTSRCRNATLMKLLSMTPLPGKAGVAAEGNGSGILQMINGMRSKALREPCFKASIDTFKVVLLRGGIEIEDNRGWIEQMPGAPFDQHEETILLLLKQRRHVSVHEARDELRIDSDIARETFAKLQRGGLVKAVDTDQYELAEATEAAALGQDRGLPRATRTSMQEGKAIVLDLLSKGELMSLRELADAGGFTVNQARLRVNALLEEGAIEATAPPTSKRRKYRTRNR